MKATDSAVYDHGWWTGKQSKENMPTLYYYNECALDDDRINLTLTSLMHVTCSVEEGENGIEGTWKYHGGNVKGGLEMRPNCMATDRRVAFNWT
jgi:hypothetical protein